MKRFKLYSGIALIAVMAFSGCTKDFQDRNTDPNTIDVVTPDLLLPGIIRSTVNQVVNESWGIGNIVIQHTAKIQFVSEDRYIWGNRDGLWENVYNNMRDVEKLIELSDARNARNYEGIALILKSWMYSLVTDAYGDVPYTDAMKSISGNFRPVYDEQETIYEGILADLERANELIGSTGESVEGDIIYGGALENWKKLGNSLRLRYLLRISGKKEVNATMQAIVADAANFPVFEGNGDNGVLQYLSAAPNQFPLHTTRVGSFDEFRLSKTLGDKLSALNDTRLTVFARPTVASEEAGTPAYNGVPNGLNETDALTYGGGAKFISRVGSVYYENAITAAGLQVAVGYIMGYPELQFILAEAVRKGMISTGQTAQWHYEEGIKASFSYFGATMPAGYLTQPGVAYTEATALQLIGTQKWISLFFTGLEAWFDWRRTGIPEITPGPSNQNGDRVPVRFAYPVSEQSLNPESRQAAVARQGADNINTKVWWNK